ncbi:hypothetical protein N7449_001672 [Penicillium cf. viridicatum]|uniref:Uncharacterized protein n=1 Tax=Penicillium cf. viridicatum TaxID=2972119 RepID=A0A9W9T9H7_9EURO|nr:hypothetical protein N7449_001672 [Penicillium cf. viridicatum]
MEDYKYLGLEGKSKSGRKFSLRGSSKRLAGDPASPTARLRPSNNDSSKQILISIFSDFVISENRCLATHPNFTSGPVSYNINASKSKHFYAFHQRKAAQASKEYFRNPANTKSANAFNTPDSTTTSTTTNMPTTANALLSNPIVRYNNLFNNQVCFFLWGHKSMVPCLWGV